MEIQEIDVYVNDPLLSADKAAEYLSVSKTSFNKLVRLGRIPYVEVIADRRYRRSDLNALVTQSLVSEPQENQ